MGCIARLGCLGLLALLAVCAWLTKDRWMQHLRGAPPPAGSERVVWQPLTLMGSRRASAALDSLASRNGPVFQNVAPGDASAYVFKALLGKLPDDADGAEAAVVGDRLRVRASVRLRDLGGAAVLGPLASLLGERERLELAGTFRVVRPGLAEFDIKEATLRDLKAPAGAIPKLLRALTGADRPAGVSDDGLVIRIPPALADVRIGNGRVTLYKGLP